MLVTTRPTRVQLRSRSSMISSSTTVCSSSYSKAAATRPAATPGMTERRRGASRTVASTCTRPPAALWFCLIITVFSCLPLFTSAQQASSCPLEMHVFQDSANCNAATQADAVGLLTPDNVCRATEVVSGDAPELLPGNYRATCTSDGRVQISESGCVSTTCASSSGGICDRQLDYASLYSRLSPPLYKLQPQDSAVVSCFALSSSDESVQVVFYITGDCAPCSSSQQSSPSPTISTAATLQPTAVFVIPSFPTDSSTIGPTVAQPPTTLRPTRTPTEEPTQEPTVPEGTPPPMSSSLEPTVSAAPAGPVVATSQPTFQLGDDDEDSAPTPDDTTSDRPSLASPPTLTRQPSTSNATLPDRDDSQSIAMPGVVIGSVVGVLAALACFLTTGFLLGRRLQHRDTLSKSLSEAESQHKEQYRQQQQQYSSTPMTMPNSFFHASPAGTASFEQNLPYNNEHHNNIMISLDDEQDDISTLEDPTVYTRDTQTTRDSVLGTTFLDNDDDTEVPTVATTDSASLLMGTQYLKDNNNTASAAASVSDSLANDSKAASSMAGGGMGGQTTSSKMTNETSSVLGLNFLSDMEEPSTSSSSNLLRPAENKRFGKAPQPQAEDDEDDDSAAWRPGAKWFGMK